MNFINNSNDIMDLLDNLVEGVSWNEFYELRERPAIFIIQNELPDENLVEFLGKDIPITSSVEFGCGEGEMQSIWQNVVYPLLLMIFHQLQLRMQRAVPIKRV